VSSFKSPSRVVVPSLARLFILYLLGGAADDEFTSRCPSSPAAVGWLRRNERGLVGGDTRAGGVLRGQPSDFGLHADPHGRRPLLQGDRGDEEDHLISLELGGAPGSKKNLWPEPWPQPRMSDPNETVWKRRVCNGTLTLRQAQKLELTYKRKHGWGPAASSAIGGTSFWSNLSFRLLGS
jgi:hypothetical protein